MMRHRGNIRRLDLDGLGRLIPDAQIDLGGIIAGLTDTMTQRRYLAGHGIPSVPTDYIVTLHPGDRAWLEPGSEDRAARALETTAARAGYLMVGSIDVRFETDEATAPGRPLFWAGFREGDLMVLAAPAAALEAFARA